MCSKLTLWKVKRSCRSWSASVSGAGFRACYVSSKMKPLLTSACSTRGRASRSTLLTKLSTPSSPFAVSGKSLLLICEGYYVSDVMFAFSLQSLISISSWYSSLERCCSSLQIHSAGNRILSVQTFKCLLKGFTGLQFLINYFPSYEGVKFFSTLLE